ncbi:MAG: ATP-binding cassette domain-containing protein [Cyanobacteria bacterium K_DeepCast_35m_m2_023]|nr:ATP-binding cassette domain-containing protein [Cyanobacteria bacterium K_DeepCast_35m_m2_023]
MTQASQLNLRELPPFQGLNDEQHTTLLQRCQVLGYTLGQPLSNRRAIPSSVLVVLQGDARLLGEEGNRSYTIGKLSAGGVVGLASLLRAAPCEEVSASGPLTALAIPDEVVLELYQQDATFKTWCDTTLHPAEIHYLMHQLMRSSPRSDINRQGLFQHLLTSAQLRTLAPGSTPGSSESEAWFVASANVVGQELGERVQADASLETEGPLPVRLIGIPQSVMEALQDATAQVAAPTGAGSTALPGADGALVINPAPQVPEVSGLDLGQSAGRSRFQLIRAQGTLQETQACLQMLAASMKLPFRKDSVEKILRDALRGNKAPSMELCGGLASMLGLQAYAARIPAHLATRLQTPALIPWQGSFALVKQSSSRGLVLASPRDGWVTIESEALAETFPEGLEVLLVDRSSASPDQKFGISWFWPALKRYRGVLLQVLLASFVVQLFGLANPLLIQVIIDKVISQRSLDTLQILGIALVVVTLLGGVIGSLRTFLFTETTNRIDTRLGSEVIDHLLRLPLGYFDNRPVGELGTRIAELEKIRNFLTGQALTTVLDAAFSVIYIIVMVLYSWLLTIIALAVVPLQIALTLIGAPLIRRQIRDTANKNAQTQSHLVEVLTGIQTVKAQNVETVSRWKWQDLYNTYIARTFEKTITGTALSETSNVLQQLSQLLVLWVGASLVLNGQLTLGQLIAFRIISGYVTQPLLRLSNIWQSVQELRVSFERLADIIDTPEESTEADKANIPLPSINGRVVFDNVSFSFKQGGTKILNKVNLEIQPGTSVGIVGQSGSGKSTLMKLLPRLYEPQEGRILIDGYDISKVELYSLRRQIGIVPQDPLLFAGTVSENIALTDPDADSDHIVRAAHIANAHEFVMSLPMGYSTNVGERGASLSGGQRQRLAIARTLLSEPRLLVLDEATSALDYDTERRVCENLREACKNSTVFFITHRLSTIRNADIIVMMHQGVIAEIGTHDELIALRGRYYALYRQQEAS